MSTAAQPATIPTKFRFDKTTSGEVTFLTFQGVIDEGFEGKKLAESIKSKKIVLNLRAVRRFASWGMSEWTEFLRVSAARDVYVIESSTQALSQFNLVTGLLGHAKLVSFYVPYRCTSCSEESEHLLVLPVERAALDALDDLADSERLCPACGGTARLGKYLAEMCAGILARPPYDVDDEVIAFLRGRYKYAITPDAARFRAGRRVHKGYTYLRLTGNVQKLPAEALARNSQGMTVVDLAGLSPETYDDKTLGAWRAYVKAALPNVGALQLLDCPSGFLTRGVALDDFPKLQVRTFALDYLCGTCNTSTTRPVDVAANLEYLVEGILPTTKCPSCKGTIEGVASPELDAIVRRLPARGHDAELDKFLDKARAEPATALEDGLVEQKARAAKQGGGATRALYIASGLMVAVTAALIALFFGVWKGKGAAGGPATTTDTVIAPKPTPQFQRPEWIVSDLPSSGFCQDLVNRLMCVGVSAYRPTRDEAVVDANDAALDELVNALALKVTDPLFKDTVLGAYSEPRAKALAALQAADLDRTSPAYAKANDKVRAVRKRVVELFRASGGPAVPAQRSDWYWEEYAVEKGTGTEVLVFVRYDVPMDALKALVERYSAPTTVLGSTAITAFPGLAWQQPEFAGGAVLTTVDGPLAAAGLAPQQLVTAVGEQKIADAGAFAKRVSERAAQGGAIPLTVKPADGAARSVEIKP